MAIYDGAGSGGFNSRWDTKRMAHHSGSIEEVKTGWYKTFALRKKISVCKKPIRGFIYKKTTFVYDATRTLTFHEYATKKELFEMKLRGEA